MFKKGDLIVCTLGVNKGKRFIVTDLLKNGVGCIEENGDTSRTYRYTETSAKKVE